jgi:hypothetical protein
MRDVFLIKRQMHSAPKWLPGGELDGRAPILAIVVNVEGSVPLERHMKILRATSRLDVDGQTSDLRAWHGKVGNHGPKIATLRHCERSQRGDHDAAHR